ncbi:MAG: DUF2490 domain-containing protein [Prolixibacteraceae bacterium]|nr:DUF2490 domain-containing protein [Prolixibacteraceae bacterium]
MIIKFNRTALILIFCFALTELNAQYVKVVGDLRSRTSVGVQKTLFDKLDLFADAELGLEQNLSKIGKLKAEAGLTYSPFKFLDFEAAYRFSKNRKNYGNNFKYTHTVLASVQLKQKIERFKLSYRLQYQNIDDDATTYTASTEYRNIYKNRIKVEYNIPKSKITPFISSELYLPSNRSGLYAGKLKSMAGIEYKIPWTKHLLKAYYRNDREITTYMPYTYHTLGLSFLFKF